MSNSLKVWTPAGVLEAKPGTDREYPGIAMLLLNSANQEAGSVSVEYDPEEQAIVIRVWSPDDPLGDPVFTHRFTVNAGDDTEAERFIALKKALFMAGDAAISDFLGYEPGSDEEPDTTDRRMDEAYEQMPDEELDKFYLKYGLLTPLDSHDA